MSVLPSIARQIAAATGKPCHVVATQPVSGGDINSAFRLQTQQQTYFVKLNQCSLLAMFEAEFAGLQALAGTQTIRTPQPILCGQTDKQAFLVLEFIEFGCTTPSSERILGQQLAALHKQPQAYFGWARANTIGSTPQINEPTNDWVEFWRSQRLGFQLKLAAQKGYRGKLQTDGEQLCMQLEAFFQNYRPQPSLLHGDLWGGNTAVDRQGNPYIFDPACYYGDRETDLAMTTLFGGFSQDFYAAYQDAWPMDSGYPVRKLLYNLYHILNHLNLFGGGYLRQAENMLAALLSQVK